MRSHQGFTLIEILIALAVFAILATLTSSSLYYAFNTRTRVTLQADKLNSIQLALSLIQQDTSQIVERAVRGKDMHLLSLFVGQAQYVEFTRDGYLNPRSVEKRSTLKRVALLCKGEQLWRRTWNTLDSVKRNDYEDRLLLDAVTHCHFNYLNQNSQLLPEWREQALNQNQHKESLPQAIQLNVVLKYWGEMNLLYIVPGGLYAE